MENGKHLPYVFPFKLKLGAMSRIWFLAGLCLFLGSGSATAQVVSLDNRTGLEFSKVMVYRERGARA